MKILGIIGVGSDVTEEILITFSAFGRYWRKNGNTMRQYIRDFKKAYDSGRREVLYNNLIQFWAPMKLGRLIKMSLNETCNKVRIGKHFSNSFLIQKCLKQGDGLSPLLFNFALEYAIRNVLKN
jgi:hypothetical protein